MSVKKYFYPLILYAYTIFTVAPTATLAANQDIRPEEVIHWEAVSGTIGSNQPGDPAGRAHVAVGLRLRTEQEFTIYKKNLEITGPAGFTVTAITAPDTTKIIDPIENKEVEVYLGGDFEVTFDGLENWPGDEFPVSVKYVGCTKVICLFPHTVELMVRVFPQEATAVAAPSEAPAAFREPTDTVAPATPAVKNNCDPAANATNSSAEGGLESKLAKLLSGGGLSLGLLLLVVFAGGVLSNLTPCVYPMIPITLRLLGRKGHSPYFGSTFYALGIVVTYSSLGLVAALSGGLFGSIMASTWFNLVFAAVMIMLGVSMLGFGDFSAIQNLGNRLGAGQPTAKNYFLMGAGAGLVAAPCTGPILAALLAYTAKNQSVTQSTALMLSYSFGFALPYLLLGGAASKASKVKIPPQAQIAVKLIFAAVMFALGLYYLRVPLYSVTISMKPYWHQLALAGLIVGSILTTLSVVIPTFMQQKTLQIFPALILGLGIFGLSQQLTATGINEACLKATWYKTEAEAFKAAAKENKPILIDMWAEWCEACKKMDATTFQDPRVQDVLSTGWVLLKLDLTETNDQNEETIARYGINGLPTMILLPADSNLVNKKALIGYQAANDLLSELDAFAKKGK